jgi:toxin ParE1/3/4
MPNVLLSHQAEIDLEDVWCFIAQTDAHTADSVLDQIAKESRTLALQPLMGRERADLQAKLRWWPSSTSFAIYYLPGYHCITVVRVLHQSMDINSKYFDSRLN